MSKNEPLDLAIKICQDNRIAYLIKETTKKHIKLLIGTKSIVLIGSFHGSYNERAINNVKSEVK